MPEVILLIDLCSNFFISTLQMNRRPPHGTPRRYNSFFILIIMILSLTFTWVKFIKIISRTISTIRLQLSEHNRTTKGAKVGAPDILIPKQRKDKIFSICLILLCWQKTFINQLVWAPHDFHISFFLLIVSPPRAKKSKISPL